MTNDLKLTVYAISSDDRRNGTTCAMFGTEAEMLDEIWTMIEPEDYDPKELPDGEFESYREKFGGDWTEAMDAYTPDDLTFITEELTIDLATVPAVAAIASALEIMIDQMKSTGAWADACNGEDDRLKSDVETAEAALAAFAGKVVAE